MSIVIETNESNVKFARALASPDKTIRDKTIVTLIKYVSSLQELSDLEMLKLWKALYYCMWLSDKQAIQQELATALSNLFKSFKVHKLAILFYKMFFQTMHREWTLLDQHRVNKFYILIRMMIREGFQYMYSKKFSQSSVESILDVIEEEVSYLFVILILICEMYF